MIGCVGNDPFGQAILDNFKENGVFVPYVESVTHSETGTAHITLADDDKEVVLPSFSVEAVNTTGAGDTFNTAFAVALAK